ncbi:hypothetical protein ACFQE8_18310 [Salinirubellus sp. GCM10025818]|uniref:hypothetical protein n=1 Tax=Salinirubellus TaxID=2162630 RepID=UPI0030CD5798
MSTEPPDRATIDQSEYGVIERVSVSIFSIVDREGRDLECADEMWHLLSGVLTPAAGTILFLIGSYLVYAVTGDTFETRGLVSSLLAAGSISATGAPIGTLMNRGAMKTGEEIQVDVQRFVGFCLLGVGFTVQLLAPLSRLSMFDGVAVPASLAGILPLLALLLMFLYIENRSLGKWDEQRATAGASSSEDESDSEGS